MLAVEKYKKGIRKIPTLSEQEIEEFYEKNKQFLSKEFAYKIMKDKNQILTESCKNNIKNYFQISERELMSGKEKMKVLKKNNKIK